MSFLKSILSNVPPVQTFTFKPPGNEKGAFKVKLRYVSPQDVETKMQEITIGQGGQIDREELFANREAKIAKMNADILEPAILSIEGMTYGSLRTLVPIDPERVKQLGGPTTAFLPSREDIRELLVGSATFSGWVLGKVQTLSGFQDEDFFGPIGTSATGPPTSTEPTQSGPTSST